MIAYPFLLPYLRNSVDEEGLCGNVSVRGNIKQRGSVGFFWGKGDCGFVTGCSM